ncbi:16S rRNA (guanine(527)-N(7))-methyltransferase RsmG [Sphingomonas sp. ac-8]|uniref:16S rRNA (guanine(527)-N(7))-methyltransferase RsmG n=1 Tax=Sphingomonas sp. ac-8 TaxID=3242977 RepID=UPI003A8083D4
MTEDEARGWFADRYDAQRVERVERFLDLVRKESAQQNVVAASTLPHLWFRHALDSGQLVELADNRTGSWIDIGTGGGFPGMVVAILRDAPTILVEPRQKRASFLRAAADALGLRNVTVEQKRVETVRSTAPAAIVSARAVAALPALFAGAGHLATRDTLWLLPKGRSARSEVEALTGSWQGVFHVEHSLTDPESLIVVARGIAPA